jgi:hypothetical protein
MANFPNVDLLDYPPPRPPDDPTHGDFAASLTPVHDGRTMNL